MGTILRCQCHVCGYKEELFVGSGLRDCEPETVLRTAPDDPSLAKAVREGARFQIDRDVAVCRKCRRLFAMPYVTYWPAGETPRHTASACPECGWLLTRLGGPVKNTACPACGQILELTPCGHWD
ncbi:MAG: hypothetical protein K2O18_18820 [Oscillospiraceae bacterium]|nr:hypothetical protein [Oscillospiraceae bacterium]